jgi:hypothetical protein
MNENKNKHLEFIHNTINRMSGNSFLIKGWTISIISVLFIFTDKEMNEEFLLISIIAVIVFWYLNAFFLQQERKFRAVYDKVRILPDEEIDFSMSTDDFKKGKFSLLSAFFGKTIWPLYLGILTMVAIGKYLLESTVANNV